MTLNEFLSLPFNNNIKLLNRIKKPDEIFIEYISFMEFPYNGFVRKNEIILSTAYSFSDEYNKLYNFIMDLYNQKACGIVLSFENNDYSILNNMLDEFSKLNFPIMIVGWNALFSEIIEKNLKEIWAEDNAKLSEMEYMQKELLNSYLLGEKLDKVAEIIKKHLNSEVVIIDRTEKIRGKSLDYIDDPSDKNFDIVSNGQYYGYVKLNSSAIKQLSSAFSRQCLTIPLTLWFDKEFSITNAIQKPKTDFLKKLINNKFESNNDLYLSADFIGLDKNKKFCCFIAYISNTNFGGNNLNYNYQKYGDGIIEQIINLADKFNRTVLALIENNNLIIFLECKADYMTSYEINEKIDNFEEKIKKNIITNDEFLWGYDNKAYLLENIKLGYDNALKALKSIIKYPLGLKRRCLNLSIKEMLCNMLADNNEIVSTAEIILNKLMTQGREKGIEYIDTLKVYINSNNNISETSRKLHIHRQSLIYRLEKIEELLDISLKNHEDIFCIEICILIFEIKINPCI